MRGRRRSSERRLFLCPVGPARRAASRTRLAKPACGRASRAARRIPASELAVCVELPRKLGAWPCPARRAALRTRRANLMCSPRHLANPGARSCLASHSCESRRANPSCALSRFVKPLCELPPQRPTAARFRRGAFMGRRPWQYSRAMRPRAAIRGNFLASCIPEGASDGKSAPSWQDMRAMHPKSPANRLSGMHSAQILPGRVPFRRTGPSNHTWGANFAREPPLHGPLESRTACESCQGPHCTGLSNLAREPLLTA